MIILGIADMEKVVRFYEDETSAMLFKGGVTR
jgi:hypothetical protein